MTPGARRLARIVGLAGAAVVAWTLVEAGPKDVVLVYDLGAAAGARTLHVEVLRGGEVLRRVELRAAPGDREVRHALRLPAGAYLLRGRIEPGAGAYAGAYAGAWERPLEVGEDATIVVPLGR